MLGKSFVLESRFKNINGWLKEQTQNALIETYEYPKIEMRSLIWLNNGLMDLYFKLKDRRVF